MIGTLHQAYYPLLKFLWGYLLEGTFRIVKMLGTKFSLFQILGTNCPTGHFLYLSLSIVTYDL